ncbi:exodeoxyribonuclease V alpha subunit [Rhodanobacter sp. ANJX3]|uniref:exodeoxyribonuclease V subunit alpha n=1 Tax=Rhodanobacter sp. ANJX3 TaxID=2723083 RepID=UPI00162189DC|nr:exodeoxyribonuclease V subunit alpha [Rhodanobacter sp. ANJX3]MBB5360596.1 exodeoxyribonuclease V alpha subunit [Rhodanobacter sp. ANJX3]
MNAYATDTGATEERVIDQTLAQWVLARTGSALLASAVRAASTAEGQGHSCAWLVDPVTDVWFDADALSALRDQPWVGDGQRFTPFVLDAQNRFYLWRNWQHESKLAAAIRQRCYGRTLPIPAETLATDVTTLFAGAASGTDDWQRAAVAAVVGTRFFVLTGGPGTGKTTTVMHMLLMLLRHANAAGLPAHPSIALAAPTGKAAQRLAQAVAKSKADLQTAWHPAEHHAFRELLQAIAQADARTLHRLLGYRPMDNSFSRDRQHPLAEDIVVVDEASMVDLAMMRQLLEALRPEAVLILLGDPNQLASVDAGSVLADIVASAPINRFPSAMHHLLGPLLTTAPETTGSDAALAGHVVTLTHTWRAGSGLQRGVESLRTAPDPAWLDNLLTQRSDGDLHLRRCDSIDTLRASVDAWIARHADMLQMLLGENATPETALQGLHQLQILCALRDGAFGAQGINALMTRRLGARFDLDVTHAWYHGRPVIITRNDYARGLFNGDVGIALAGADGLRVWFELSDRDGNSGLRSFSPRALPAHDSAWAITIHRSQGSEYRSVAVVLPPDDTNRILTRELVYTAISRARSHAEIWATDATLIASLARPVRRFGGLPEKLAQRLS